MPIYTLTLLDRKTVANNTIELTFAKPEGFTFKAGQYCGFTLVNPAETDDKGTNRRFSLLCTPDDETLSLVTRIQLSAYKRNLLNMPLGHTIKMAGPTGNFTLHEDSSIPAVLIAGGMGIAPFYSIIRDALAHRPEQKITLFYGNQTLADTAYLEELFALAKEHPNLKFIPVLMSPPDAWQAEQGFISDALLVKHMPDISAPIYYICGSGAMVNAMQQMLRELDIPDEHIKVEDFPGY
jgi:ferredoxin-NADP reductase